MKYISPGVSYLISRCFCKCICHCVGGKCPAYNPGFCLKFEPKKHKPITKRQARNRCEYIKKNSIYKEAGSDSVNATCIMRHMEPILHLRWEYVTEQDIVEFITLMFPISKVK